MVLKLGSDAVSWLPGWDDSEMSSFLLLDVTLSMDREVTKVVTAASRLSFKPSF